MNNLPKGKHRRIFLSDMLLVLPTRKDPEEVDGDVDILIKVLNEVSAELRHLEEVGTRQVQSVIRALTRNREDCLAALELASARYRELGCPSSKIATLNSALDAARSPTHDDAEVERVLAILIAEHVGPSVMARLRRTASTIVNKKGKRT